MPEYVWRQSGLDGRDHAFRAEGGYVRSVFVEHAEMDPVEHKVSECGQSLPVAFVMPHAGGQRCERCERMTATCRRPLITSPETIAAMVTQ